MNRVVLVGRLAADPELKYTPSGVAVTNFRIAVDRGFKNRDGQREVDFFAIVAWRGTAEFVGKYLIKGRLVGVDGRLQRRSWQTPQGEKRSVVEVVADRVQALGPKPQGQAQQGRGEMEGQPEGEPPTQPDDPFPD